jgi:hypothetical protein
MDLAPISKQSMQGGIWKIVHELFSKAIHTRHNFVLLIQVILLKNFLFG